MRFDADVTDFLPLPGCVEEVEENPFSLLLLLVTLKDEFIVR